MAQPPLLTADFLNFDVLLEDLDPQHAAGWVTGPSRDARGHALLAFEDLMAREHANDVSTDPTIPEIPYFFGELGQGCHNPGCSTAVSRDPAEVPNQVDDAASTETLCGTSTVAPLSDAGSPTQGQGRPRPADRCLYKLGWMAWANTLGYCSWAL